MTDAPLAAIIEDTARRLTAGAPPPRGLPYLGLESTSGTGSHLLDELSAHGIFRKYELVLDLAGGLGGTGRWLAGRRGCTAVVTAAQPAVATAGAVLTRRARLRAQVHHVCARPGALPFRDGRFTHAWIVESLADLGDIQPALAEVFRVVRPGGHLAVQELVGDGCNPPGDALQAAGFVDLAIRIVDDPAERAARVVAARAQLQGQLATTPSLAGIGARRVALAAAVHEGRLRVAQLVARRP